MPTAFVDVPGSVDELRRDLALVHSLLDELDRLASRRGDGRLGLAFREQLVEELTRLGCAILEHAATLTGGAVSAVMQTAAPPS